MVWRLIAVWLFAAAIAGCSGGSSSGSPAANGTGSAGNPATDPVSDPTNKAPIARRDTVAVTGAAINIGVLANDEDPDGDPLAIADIDTPEHGIAVIMSNGTETASDDFVRYVPTPGYSGSDRFSYLVSDGQGGTALGEVSLSVARTASAVLLADDRGSTPADTALVLDVLANDSSPTTAALRLVSVTSPLHGLARTDDNGTPADTGDDVIVYSPNPGYAGPDSFFYQATDGVSTAMAAVNVSVTGLPAGGGPPVEPPSGTVAGNVMIGPVSGAQVSLYPVTDAGLSAAATPVARTVTDVYGNWSVDLPADHDALLVVAAGGTFPDQTDPTINPDDRRIVALTAGDVLEGLLPAGEAFASINPYSNALLIGARNDSGGAGFLDTFALNRGAAAATYGFDLVATPPDDPSAPDPSSPIAARQYANAIGGLATALNNLALDAGLSGINGAAIRAIVRDLSACRLDGRDAAGIVTINVGGLDRPIVANLNLNLSILRFRNNNIGVYGNTPVLSVSLPACDSDVTPPPADTTAPVFPLTPAMLAVAATGPTGVDAAHPAVQSWLAAVVATDDRDGVVTVATDVPSVLPPGDTVVTFTASDAAGNTATVSAVIRVIAGSAPVLVSPAGNQAATQGAAFSLDAGAAFIDPDGDTLVFSAAGLPTSLVIDPATGLITGTPANADALVGSFTVTVSASDGNLSATDTFVLTVANINDRPVVVTALPNQSAVENLSVLFNLGAAFADPDGDALTFTIAGMTPGSGLIFNPATGTLSGTPNDADATVGLVNLTVTASDGSLAASDSFALIITDVNNPPSGLALSGSSVAENLPAATAVGNFTALDPDTADTHTYSLVGGTGSSGNGAFTIAGATLRTTAPLDYETQASYSIRVRASDGRGGVRDEVFAIAVTDSVENQVPTTTGLGNVSVLEDAADTVLDLHAAFDDVEDADSDLSFSVTANTNPGLVAATVDDLAGTLRLSFTANDFGSADLTVRATDTVGAFVQTSLRVDVTTQADLSLTIGVDNPAPLPGDSVVLTVLLANAGPSRATDFQVSVPLPAGYTYITANNPGEYDEATGIWSKSSISGTSTLTLTAAVETPGPYDVTAELIAVNEPDPDSVPGNGVVTEDDYDSVTVIPRDESDLELSMSVDDPVPETGDSVTIVVTVTNQGPQSTTGIAIVNQPPPGLTFDMVSPSVGVYDGPSGTWDGFGLANGASATLTIGATVLAGPGTVVTNRAQIVAQANYDADEIDLETQDLTVMGPGVDITWIGGDPGGASDWSIGANWSAGTVPGSFDSITIPVTADAPVLDSDRSIVRVDVDSGAVLDLGGHALSVYGEIRSDGDVTGPCPASRVVMLGGQISGNFPSVQIAGQVNGDGTINIACNMTIGSGRFHQDGATVNVAGNFAVIGSGILLQHHGNQDALHVTGDVLFAGADHSIPVDGQAPLIDGFIYVGGDFAQFGHPHAFAAEGKHTVVLNGAASQIVWMSNPDNSRPDPEDPPDSGSRFAVLRIDKNPGDGAVDFISDAAVLKKLEVLEDFSPVLTSSTGNRIVAGGLDIEDILPGQQDSVTFDGVPLQVVKGGKIRQFDGARFTNMDPATVQFSVVRGNLNGLPQGTVNNLSFETTPDVAMGGAYVHATNTQSGGNYTLTIDNSVPLHGLPWTTTAGNATLIWGTASDDSDGDRISDEDEFAAGTNPRSADTDGDGLDDPAELLAGTDPNNPDTDGDGVGDGPEAAAGGDPTVAMAPGNVFYVRPFPAGNDGNAGTGGWSDALATNAGVAGKLTDGIDPSDPVYVLYEGGTYEALVIDKKNVAFVGSLQPGAYGPAWPPTTVFDTSATNNTPVVHVAGTTAVTLQNIHLTGADNTGGGPPTGKKGGGLHVGAGADVRIVKTVIEGNVANSQGAGFYVETGAYLTVVDSLVARNTLTGSSGPDAHGGGGGAVLGGLYLRDSVIASNRAQGTDPQDGGGGLYLAASGTADVDHSLIVGNIAQRQGGGLLVAGAGTGASVFNSLIVGNAGSSGGGLAATGIAGGIPFFVSSNTVAYNQSLDAGSGGGIDLGDAADTQLRDNIVWFNDDGTPGAVGTDNYLDRDGTAFAEFNNFQDDPTGGLNFNIDGDPKFVGGFYLEPSSPSANNGSTTSAVAGLDDPYTTRQDGMTDTGPLNHGYHYTNGDIGPATAVALRQWACDNPGELTLRFAPTRYVRGSGDVDLGPGHLVSAGIDPGSATGTIDDRSAITRLQPAGSTMRVAVDEGNGDYRITVHDVVVSSGSVILEFEIDGIDDGLTITSPALTTIPGC